MNINCANKKLAKAFGKQEGGMINIPSRFSNIQFARILYGVERGCSWCFPHGWETNNSTIGKRQRNWKKYRKHQWKASS